MCARALIKAGPDLRPAPYSGRGLNCAEGNRSPGLYSRKYGMCVLSWDVQSRECEHGAGHVRKK